MLKREGRESVGSRPKRLHRVLKQTQMPRYFQVAAVLRKRVRDGVWPVGTRISTIDELEAEFGVARVTVRQAIDILRNEGALETRQGSGTYVVDDLAEERWLHLGTSWSELLAPIAHNVPRLVPVRHGEAIAPPVIAPDEGAAAAGYVFLRSVQSRQGKPYALARIHVADHIYKRAPKAFARRVALAVIREMKGVKLKSARQTMEIGEADIEAAQLLDLRLNAPVVEARVTAVDGRGIVIYVGQITYRGDCVRISIELGGDR